MQSNTFEFKIDEYEKSTKEFEKYVNTIPKIVPIKLTKSNTIGSLVKDLYQKSQFSSTEELVILQNVLDSLKSWGKKPIKSNSNRMETVLKLSERQEELSKQLEETLKKIQILCEEIEYKTGETNGFTSEKEIEDVIKVLNSRIGKQENKAKDNEKIILQIQDLREIIPQVKYIQKLIGNVEVLEREKDLIVEYLEEVDIQYEKLCVEE